jgi:hypothetical protein
MHVTSPKAPQDRFVLNLDNVTVFDQVVVVGVDPTYSVNPALLADGTHTLDLMVFDATSGETATASTSVNVAGGAFASAPGAVDVDVATRLRIDSMFAATEVPVRAHLAGIEAGFMRITMPPQCPQLPDGSTFLPSNYRGSSTALLGTPNVPYVSQCDAENAVIAKFSTTTGAATTPAFLVGGSSDDSPVGVGVDASNNVYVAGQTASADFPTSNDITGTTGQPDPSKARLTSGDASITAFVMKLTLPAPNTNTAPVQQYSSLLGGSGETTVSGLAVTPSGNVFVSGVTTSTDVNVVPPAPAANTATAYIIQIPPATVTDPAPALTVDNQLLSAPATSGASLAISVDVDGNVVVAGAPEDGGTLGIKLTATIETTIDIKPKAKKNKINLAARTVQVAILSTPFFNAVERIDRTSLKFGATGNEASLLKCDKKGRNVNPGNKGNKDRLKDLVCTFRVEKTNFTAANTVGFLKGKTKSGADIVGSHAVTIVPKKKGEKDRDCDDDDTPWDDKDDN